MTAFMARIVRSLFRLSGRFALLSKTTGSHKLLHHESRWILYLIRGAAAGVILLSPHLKIQSSSPKSVWVVPGLETVRQTDPVGESGAATLFAARGEYEAFQIVVRAPDSGLHEVTVNTSDLAGPTDQIIAKRHLTVYREHYVHVERPSPDHDGPNRSEGAGWYPDALIKLETGDDVGIARTSTPRRRAAGRLGDHFDVEPGTNQPLWVDVFVPRNARPGVYKGSIRISSREESAEVPVTLNVWDFELPLKPALKSSFGYWSPTKEGIEELLRHKVMPGRLRSYPCIEGLCSGQAQTEYELMEGFGLSMADVGFWSGAYFGNCEMSPAPSVKQLLSAAAFHARGLDLFNYTADEIRNCPELHMSLKKWGRNMHLAGIKNMVVMEPKPELFDDGSGTGRSAVDIWVVLPKHHRAAEEFISQALGKGDQVWSYNTLSQDSDSPKWLIDYDPINFRIQPGFLSQSLQFTGILYWRVDRWSREQWDDVNNVGAFADGANYPGEGILIYPGTEAGVKGVAPSIRLKQIREGIEDYEYVEILKSLDRSAWAIERVKKIAPDWTHWSKDRGELEALRWQLGAEIHRIRSEQSGESK
jgi:hypothetical protein